MEESVPNSSDESDAVANLTGRNDPTKMLNLEFVNVESKFFAETFTSNNSKDDSNIENCEDKIITISIAEDNIKTVYTKPTCAEFTQSKSQKSIPEECQEIEQNLNLGLESTIPGRSFHEMEPQKSPSNRNRPSKNPRKLVNFFKGCKNFLHGYKPSNNATESDQEESPNGIQDRQESSNCAALENVLVQKEMLQDLDRNEYKFKVIQKESPNEIIQNYFEPPSFNQVESLNKSVENDFEQVLHHNYLLKEISPNEKEEVCGGTAQTISENCQNKKESFSGMSQENSHVINQNLQVVLKQNNIKADNINENYSKSLRKTTQNVEESNSDLQTLSDVTFLHPKDSSNDILKEAIEFAHIEEESCFAVTNDKVQYMFEIELEEESISDDLLLPPRAREKVQFVCKVCKIVLPWKSHLLAHMQQHSQDRLFQCHLCNKSFTTKRNLNNHIDQHKGVKKFQCETCGKEFTTKHNLKKHQENHLKGKTWFVCKICEEAFSLKTLWEKHMTTHDDNKTYGCELCNQWFSREGYLRKHQRLKHSIVGLKVDNLEESMSDGET